MKKSIGTLNHKRAIQFLMNGGHIFRQRAKWLVNDGVKTFEYKTLEGHDRELIDHMLREGRAIEDVTGHPDLQQWTIISVYAGNRGYV